MENGFFIFYGFRFWKKTKKNRINIRCDTPRWIFLRQPFVVLNGNNSYSSFVDYLNYKHWLVNEETRAKFMNASASKSSKKIKC